MATWSMPFTDTVSNPAPPGAPHAQTGDGRPYTAAEWRLFWKYVFARGGAGRGVLKGALNECLVSIIGVKDLQVDTGCIICNGGVVIMETHEHLAPVSAGPGLTRKDSVICELDLDGSGSTEQYTVRVVLKQGTAGAYPAMTQTAVLWQIRLANYDINDAGFIFLIADTREFLRTASEYDHSEALNLSADSHTQYFNVARHTKAVHDALGIDAATVGGFTPGALMGGIALGFKGTTVLWGGALGGSDGHRPLDVISGAAHEDWHWANGETVSGVTTLDSRGKVALGSDGAAGTYPVNSTGGAAQYDISHTHTEGSLAAAFHAHAKGTLVTVLDGTHAHFIPANQTLNEPDHNHWVTVNTSAPSGGPCIVTPGAGLALNTNIHFHTFAVASGAGGGHHHNTYTASTAIGFPDKHTHAVSGSTAGATPAVTGTTSTSSVSNIPIMPPYRAWYMITFIG